MQPFPHRYVVRAKASEESPIVLDSPGLDVLISAPPREFEGPGTMWSPETLLVGAVCDCFILTFRAISRAAKLQWTQLTCQGTGTVARDSEGITRFTAIDLKVQLEVTNSAEWEKATQLLEKTKKSCLVSNSLRLTPSLHMDVSVKQAA